MITRCVVKPPNNQTSRMKYRAGRPSCKESAAQRHHLSGVSVAARPDEYVEFCQSARVTCSYVLRRNGQFGAYALSLGKAVGESRVT